MATQAEFGIKTLSDLQAIDALIERLVKLQDLVTKTAEKSAISFVAADGKIVTSATASAAKVTEARVKSESDQTNAADAAAKRRAEILDRAVALEKRAEKQKTEELVNDIFELQKKRGIAVEARKQAALEGSKSEVAAQKKVVAGLDEELSVLKKLSIERKEVQKEGAGAKIGQLGTGREANKGSSEHKDGGMGIGEIAGIGAAVEGFKVLSEHAEEAAKAQKDLQVGTGLSGEALEKAGKDAEEVGEKYGISGEEIKSTAGKISSFTGATGEKLKEQTEAVTAYAVAHQLSAEKVSKQFGTNAKMQAEIMKESSANQAKALAATDNPAQNMQRIMNRVTETIGGLAMKIMNALNPVLKAVLPILDVVADLLSSTLMPILAAIVPVITLLANSFKDLAPVVVELVQGALALISPILKNLGDIFSQILPIIIDVVKQVAGSLTPIFKALAPIINEVAGVIRDVLTAVIGGGLLPILADLLVPVLRDLVAPILLSLMPIIKALADILQAILVPAVQILSGILKIIVSDAIAPLIKWLTGALKTAIDDTVGYITAAIGAITKVVGAITSFLGLSNDAKAAAKKNGAEVGKAVIEGANEAIKTTPFDMPEPKGKKEKLSNDQKFEKKSLADQMSALIGFEKESQDLELQTQEETLTKLQALQSDPKYKIGAGDTASMIRDKTKALGEVNKAITALQEQQFKDEVSARNVADEALKNIEQKKFNTGQITQEQFNKRNEEINTAHYDALVAIDKKYDEESIDDELKGDEARTNLKKAAAQKAKQIKKQEYDVELELQVNFISAEKDGLQKSVDQEQLAFKDSLKKLRDQLEDKALTQAQYNALEKDAQAKHLLDLAAIQKKADEDLQALDKQKIAWLTGPLTHAFEKTGEDIDKKFFAPFIQKALGGKTFFAQFVGEIVSGLLKTGVTMITQYAEGLAAQIAFGSASVAAATATNTAILASAAPAAAAESVATLGGASAAGGAGLLSMLGSVVPAVLGLIPHNEAGTDNWRGGLTWVGERGPELLNAPERSQIIPNHHLPNLGQPAQDLSPLISRLDSIHRATVQGNQIFANRPAPILPVNSGTLGVFNQASKAENRREF